MTDPLLDRLMVALAARGSQRIGQFISMAVNHSDIAELFYLSDEALVLALEAAVQP